MLRTYMLYANALELVIYYDEHNFAMRFFELLRIMTVSVTTALHSVY